MCVGEMCVCFLIVDSIGEVLRTKERIPTIVIFCCPKIVQKIATQTLLMVNTIFENVNFPFLKIFRENVSD